MTAGPASTISAPVLLTIIAGGGLLVLATALALRPRAGASGFGWIVVAGMGCSLLGLASPLQSPGGDGLRAGLVHLVAVLLAALLGGLSAPRRGAAETPTNALGVAAWGCAWLTLLGFPPTVGFPAKVALYRALFGCGWGGLAALAMAASAAALVPARWGLRFRARALEGTWAAVGVLLVALILALGLYPGPLLDLLGGMGAAAGPAG